MRASNLNKILARISCDTVLFASVLFAPWWLTLLLTLTFLMLFQNFFEAFIAGLIIDALYGASSLNLYGFHLFYSAIFFTMWVLATIARSKMRLSIL